MINFNKIFTPSIAIRGEHQENFIGRENFIKKGLISLHNESACLAIIGERGIGKTSLGWQIQEILLGNTNLLYQNKISVPIDLENHFCAWIECNTKLTNIEGVIIQLLSNIEFSRFTKNIILDQQVDQVIHDLIGQEGIEILSKSSRIRDIEISIEIQKALINLKDSQKQLLYKIFTIVANEIKEEYSKKLIIFIDEFDKLPNKEGLGDLIKSTKNVNFVIIGIADSLRDIVTNSPSIERKFLNSTINLGGLTANDIEILFNRAEHNLSDYRIRFSKVFRQRVLEYSDGFPYLVQSFGNIALAHKLTHVILDNKQEIVIKGSDFDISLSEIIRPDIDVQLRYEKLESIDNSGKENILFVLAEQNGWVNERTIIQSLESKYRFLVNIHELRESGIIKLMDEKLRFTDPILKAIVKYKKANKDRLYNKQKAKEKYSRHKSY